MKILDIDQDSQEWLEARRNKITGSKLKDLYSPRGERKDGFYQLLADRLALIDESGDSSDRDRGHEKEVEALEMYEAETGKVVDKKPGMWISEENENIALSPDGGIKNKKGVFTEAVEVKCLAAKNHLRAIIENKIPKDFHLQVIHYFITNPDLTVVHFVFYDDRITARPFHMIDVNLEEVKEEVERMKLWEMETLAEVEELAVKLAF